MKKSILQLLFIASFIHSPIHSFAQNIGVGMVTPLGKLHIHGSEDISQLIIDANSTQGNANPLIRLRKSNGTDLMWIHSDHLTNLFLGIDAGKVNNGAGTGLNNIFIGNSAGRFNSTGNQNIAIGTSTLYSNTTGYLNVAVGTAALLSNTTGHENSAVGIEALYYNTIGNYNTAIGSEAMYRNTKGVDNTVMGANALFNNATGSQNTVIGKDALSTQSYDPGNAWNSDNVAVGYQALHSNQPTSISNGVNNTAVGTFSLRANTIGIENASNGYKALYSNTIGNYNTANGCVALYSNTFGNANTSIGAYALFSNTTASQNTAIGLNALRSQSYNFSGAQWVSGNVAVGAEALYSNQPTSSVNGVFNTAIGHSALRSNTIGWYNTANGYAALYSNTTGFANSANGYAALYSNTTGKHNTADGYAALHFNTTGRYNTALGTNALYLNTTGELNVAIGQDAYFTGTGLENTICIGFNSGKASNASNRVEIGNQFVTWIGGQMSWSTYSDGRIKENVQENVPGLSFINRLRPVTYNLNVHKENELMHKEGIEEAEWPTKYDIEKLRLTGFIAQEVEQAAQEVGYDFSGVEKPQNEGELYSVRYSDFIMPLVKSVQELSALNESQNLIIENLKSQNELLTQRLEKIESLIEANNHTSDKLKHQQP